MATPDLESIYREAQSALKSRDYVHASELLRQILVVDENYKDVSRLLAQTVKLKRRRWYNDPRLWSTIGLVIIVLLGFFIAPRLRELYAAQPSAPVIIDSPTATLPPTVIVTATETLPPTQTPIPLIWKRVSIGQEFERDTVTAFVIDPKDQDVLYAGMKNAGIYKSIDGGLSWHPSHFGLSNTHVQSLSINPNNSQILYAGTLGGIFQTEDGGGNWSKISTRTYLLMDPQDGSHLYVRDSEGIYESTDGGTNWKSVYSSKEECPGEILGWAIHPVDGNTLFVGGGEKCEPGVYLSNDSGHTWTLLAKREIRPGDYTIYDIGLDSLVIGLDRQGDFYIYTHGTSRGVIHNENGIWRTILDFKSPVPETVAFDSTTSVYYYCEPNLCKFNLDERQKLTLGEPDIGTVTSIIVSPFEPNTIYVGGEGLSVSRDGGVTWEKLKNGMGNTLLHLDTGGADNSVLYVSSGECQDIWTPQTGNKKFEHHKGQPLYLSTDNGKTWKLANQTGCYLIKDADGSTFYRIDTGPGGYPEGSVWRSTDEGESWNKIITQRKVVTLASDRTKSGLLYIYSEPWDLPYQQYISEDYGSNWKIKDSQTDLKFCYGSTPRFVDKYRPMAIDPWDGNHVFVINNGTLLESHDSCDTAETFTTPPDASVNSIAFDSKETGILYAGADSGAYISYDAGATWGQVNDGLLGATVVYSIVVDKDGNVYAATPYGVFKLESKQK